MKKKSNGFGKIGRVGLFVCLVLFFGAVFGKDLSEAKAAEYRNVYENYRENDVKDGRYILHKAGTTAGSITWIKKGNGLYEATPMPTSKVFGNGKQAIYLKNGVLYKYVYASKKETALKKICSPTDHDYYVSTIYKSKVFIGRSSFEDWKHTTYMYDMSKKNSKVKKVKSNCLIHDRYKNYVVTQKGFFTDISPYGIEVYRITSSGLKKLRTIAKRGTCPRYIGGKLYYAEYPVKGMKKCIIYRCKPDGTKKKKIKTITAKGEYAYVCVVNITSKYCEYSINSDYYKYTYATKKTVKVYR